MRNAISLQPGTTIESSDDHSEPSNADLSVVLRFQSASHFGSLRRKRHESGGQSGRWRRAGLRPLPKLHVHVSCMQLSGRLSDAGMQEKELNRSTAPVRTRRKAWSQAAVSSRDCANAGTDATRKTFAAQCPPPPRSLLGVKVPILPAFC